MQTLSITPAALFIETSPVALPSERLRILADAVELFDGSARETPDAVTLAATDGVLSVAVELMGRASLPGSAELLEAVEAFLAANGRF